MAPTLAEATRRLAGLSETPRLDAELLLAHALGVSREALLLGRAGETVPDAFEGLLRRRLRHEPVAYITGRRGFWTIELHVTPDTLIPRPETELLLEAALERFGAAGPSRILDLGTGSGALLLAALAQWPRATGVGVDRSTGALAVARGNAEALGLAGRAIFREAGWEQARQGGFDLVLCNPPYIGTGEPLPRDVIEHEPASALFAGADGLDDLRVLAGQLRLPPGGLACLEIGAAQGRAALDLFAGNGFRPILRQDLAGLDRCILIRAA